MATVAFRRGKWHLDYYDQTGKRCRKTTKWKTKAETKAELRVIEDAIAKGVYLPAKKIPTFGEVCREWLAYKKPKVRASSLSNYALYMGKHFGTFENLRINLLTTARIESFITQKQTEGLSVKTVRYLIGLTNQVLKYAIRHKFIESNPLSPVERPRGTTEQKGKFLTPEEINRVLTAEKDPMYRILFKLAILSGARRGELLGLTWADVSFSEKQIRIERSYNHGAVYEPKNRTSRRKIDLGEDMMRTLRDWRKTNLQNELVFCRKEGKHLVGDTVTNRFRKALKAAGLPESIRFHDLRHTNASLLIHQGENIKVIQTQLGHSTPIQTLNTYAHLMKESNHDVAERLEEAVLNGAGHKTVTKAI